VLYVSDYAVRLPSGPSTKVATSRLSAPTNVALYCIDGLGGHNGALIGVHNGSSRARSVTRSHAGLLAHLSVAHPRMNHPPVRVADDRVVVADMYYYVANSFGGLIPDLIPSRLSALQSPDSETQDWMYYPFHKPTPFTALPRLTTGGANHLRHDHRVCPFRLTTTLPTLPTRSLDVSCPRIKHVAVIENAVASLGGNLLNLQLHRRCRLLSQTLTVCSGSAAPSMAKSTFP